MAAIACGVPGGTAEAAPRRDLETGSGVDCLLGWERPQGGRPAAPVNRARGCAVTARCLLPVRLSRGADGAWMLSLVVLTGPAPVCPSGRLALGRSLGSGEGSARPREAAMPRLELEGWARWDREGG